MEIDNGTKQQVAERMGLQRQLGDYAHLDQCRADLATASAFAKRHPEIALAKEIVEDLTRLRDGWRDNELRRLAVTNHTDVVARIDQVTNAVVETRDGQNVLRELVEGQVHLELSRIGGELSEVRSGVYEHLPTQIAEANANFATFRSHVTNQSADTKANIDTLRSDVETEFARTNNYINELRVSLTTEIADVRVSLTTEIADVRVSLTTEIADLRVSQNAQMSALSASLDAKIDGAVRVIAAMLREERDRIGL